MTYLKAPGALVLGGIVLLASAIAFPDAVGAQVGGLLRRKAEEAAKKVTGEPPPPPSQPPSQPAAPTPPAAESADGPVLPITDTSLLAFEKSLETEISLREDYRKELSTLKTPDQYDQCRTQAALSPEAQKIAERMGNISDTLKPEEQQKAMLDLAKELEAVSVKACGADPSPRTNASARERRLREIEAQAAASSGPVR